MVRNLLKMQRPVLCAILLPSFLIFEPSSASVNNKQVFDHFLFYVSTCLILYHCIGSISMTLTINLFPLSMVFEKRLQEYSHHIIVFPLYNPQYTYHLRELLHLLLVSCQCACLIKTSLNIQMVSVCSWALKCWSVLYLLYTDFYTKGIHELAWQFVLKTESVLFTAQLQCSVTTTLIYKYAWHLLPHITCACLYIP